MFAHHIVTPETFAMKFLELLPEYLPGVDTGAFEATDRRRCWNKTLSAVLTAIGNELGGLRVAAEDPMMTLLKDQSSLMWKRGEAPVFAMATGWGVGRNWEAASLEWLEAFKCPQKLFVYSCARWQDAVLDQIRGALFRYPWHLDGEQYLFLNSWAPKPGSIFSWGIVSKRPLSLDGRDRPASCAGSPFSWGGEPLRVASNKQ